MASSTVIDFAVAVMLVLIAREDGRWFRIPNALVLALVLACPIAFQIQGRFNLLLPHGLFALAALAVLFLGFAAGICGGGDAKLLATALFWIGPEGTLVFALLLLPAVVVYAAAARFGLLPARRDGRRLRIPLAPSIAVAWIGVIGLSHVRL